MLVKAMEQPRDSVVKLNNMDKELLALVLNWDKEHMVMLNKELNKVIHMVNKVLRLDSKEYKVVPNTDKLVSPVNSVQDLTMDPLQEFKVDKPVLNMVKPAPNTDKLVSPVNSVLDLTMDPLQEFKVDKLLHNMVKPAPNTDKLASTVSLVHSVQDHICNITTTTINPDRQPTIVDTTKPDFLLELVFMVLLQVPQPVSLI